MKNHRDLTGGESMIKEAPPKEIQFQKSKMRKGTKQERDLRVKLKTVEREREKEKMKEKYFEELVELKKKHHEEKSKIIEECERERIDSDFEMKKDEKVREFQRKMGIQKLIQQFEDEHGMLDEWDEEEWKVKEKVTKNMIDWREKEGGQKDESKSSLGMEKEIEVPIKKEREQERDKKKEQEKERRSSSKFLTRKTLDQTVLTSVSLPWSSSSSLPLLWTPLPALSFILPVSPSASYHGPDTHDFSLSPI
jgi:hypothetical protein